MKYIQISEPVYLDLLSAKAKVNDINELVTDWTFRPNAREWREILQQIINTTRYMPDEKEE
jgi:hypothetical protein